MLLLNKGSFERVTGNGRGGLAGELPGFAGGVEGGMLMTIEDYCELLCEFFQTIVILTLIMVNFIFHRLIGGSSDSMTKQECT